MAAPMDETVTYEALADLEVEFDEVETEISTRALLHIMTLDLD